MYSVYSSNLFFRAASSKWVPHTHRDPVSGFNGNCAVTPAIHRAVKTTVWGLGQVQEVAAPPWRALGGGHAFCNEEQLKLLAYY